MRYTTQNGYIIHSGKVTPPNPVEPSEECGASDRGCQLGPYGPDGSIQCRYCGKPKPAPQGDSLPPRPEEYRYKTSEEAALLPLSLQILRLKEINEQLCRNHNTLLIENVDLERQIQSQPKPAVPIEIVTDSFIENAKQQAMPTMLATALNELQQWRVFGRAYVKGAQK